MLWHKFWLETRSRFLIGLGLLICAAAGVVFSYHRIAELVQLVTVRDTDGELGRRIRASAELVRDYRGYVWSQWFGQQLTRGWTLFAVLLGTGGLVSQAARGGGLFTLSLPVARGRLVRVRAVVGLAELAVLALVPSLVIVALSPAVGAHYPLGDALVHSACLYVAGSVFFSLATLLATVFGDIWRPLLIALAIAIVLGLLDLAAPGAARFSVFSVMSADDYFHGRGLPWLGLVASAAASVAMHHGTTRNIARQDF
jgi:hypothetical protein